MKRGPVPKRLPRSAHFGQFMQPIVSKLKNIPDLNSGGHRPLKVDFEEQLRILVYFTFKDTALPNICFKPAKKMILPANTSLLNKALKNSASQKPSTIVVSNSCSTFSRGYSGLSFVRLDQHVKRITLFNFTLVNKKNS